MKNIKKLLLGLLITLGLSACSNITPVVNNNANNKKVEAVTLNVTGEVVMELGQTLTVTPTITFDGDPVEVDEVWSSSRPKVASVAPGEASATVTALSAGSSKISFIAGLKMAYFTVTIYGQNSGGGDNGGGSSDTPVTPDNPTVTGITLNTYSRTLAVNETFQILVTLSNPDGLDETVTFETENSAVAVVTEAGLVQARGAGTTNIVVNALGKTAKCEIIVKADDEPEDEEGDYDFVVYFFIDYNNIDENDVDANGNPTGNKLLAKFGWYHNEPIANSGKVPADPTQALDPAFPYFVGWSTHTIIDTAADLVDLNTYVVENAHFLFIYGIWSDVPKGEFKL